MKNKNESLEVIINEQSYLLDPKLAKAFEKYWGYTETKTKNETKWYIKMLIIIALIIILPIVIITSIIVVAINNEKINTKLKKVKNRLLNEK